MTLASSVQSAETNLAACLQGQIAIRAGYLRYLDSDKATLEALNMQIPVGKWTCILGRSGCGKTSLLRYMAGLLDEVAEWRGELTVNRGQSSNGRVDSHLNHPLSLVNNIAYMAQQDLLMPWLTALENVLLSTRFSQVGEHSSEDQNEKARHLLQMVGLADKAHLTPQQLSGGMRQRVALARTLMQDKPIVLMDEPFSALDAVTRHRLQNLAYELLQSKTVMLITHDPQEAIRLGHKLYVMQGAPACANHIELPPQICTPETEMPRKYCADSAVLQQAIIDRLEKDYA